MLYWSIIYICNAVEYISVYVTPIYYIRQACGVHQQQCGSPGAAGAGGRGLPRRGYKVYSVYIGCI